MPGQQRGVVSDAAEPCSGQCLLADAGVAVRGHDQVGIGCDLGGRHQFGIGLHRHLDTGGLGCGGQPVIAVVDHHPDDIDAAFAQHVQGRHAEMAGADEGNPHGGEVHWLMRPICR